MTAVAGIRAVEPPSLDSQRDVVAFLSSPGTYGEASVERIDTHASMLFLVGERAWKLKRAVHYDYLDYSTVERRRVMCEAEFALGRRLAPALYRRVVSVNRDTRGKLSIDGPGTATDWLVEMTRFDQDELFDRLASRGWLDVAEMPGLARAIATLHRNAERQPDRGGYAGMAWVIEGNAAAFVSDPTGALNPAVCARVIAAARGLNDRLRSRLDARRQQGFVRRCHGDLHLRNVVRLNGEPTLFDPVEFNDAIACIDVMYDLSFLLMDLERLSLGAHANALLNAYITETQDVTGLPALPLFLSCRAAVRAKTRATAASLQSLSEQRAEDTEAAARYLDLADRLLRAEPPCLVAIGGRSGSGKSSLARALAPYVGPTPGALIVRSDELRKALHGVPPHVRLEPAAYTLEASRRVYNEMAGRVHSVLVNQHAAVADAVFLRPDDRQLVERTAHNVGVPFIGLWLEAPEPVLIERLAGRHADASDATGEVIRSQMREDPGPMTWHYLDASLPPALVAENAVSIVRSVLGRGASDDLQSGAPT